jgi:hypothetical protein
VATKPKPRTTAQRQRAAQTQHRRAWLPGRKPSPSAQRLRVLTAAAQRLDLTDRKQARQTRTLRQGWQIEAWAYRDSVPELRYAAAFSANCAARMRFFPAAYPLAGETDTPVPLAEAGAPPELVEVCNNAMSDLGNGRLAISQLVKSLDSNRFIAGECYLLGQEDPDTGAQTWSIRSIDEIIIYDDVYKLREVPMDPQGILGWIDLDPDFTIVERLWIPHPRFRLLGDSALRALIDDMEGLIILRRMIRATGRSRIAARGILLVPDEVSIDVPDDDDADPEADPFMGALTRALIEPIGDEGVASAVAPPIVRGPAEALKEMRLLEFASAFDEMSIKTREELVGILATGVDLPKEVIIGFADLNHWSAWQVSDDTFRHHIEPGVIEDADMLSGGYLRPYIAASDLPDAVLKVWLPRTLMWYDPVELVTKPDQTANAQNAHAAIAISDASYRTALGFAESDAPDAAEIEIRMIRTTRNYPPNLLMALMHELDPSLVVPAMTGPPALPGIKPSGVEVPEGPGAPPTDDTGAPPDVPSPPPDDDTMTGPTPSDTSAPDDPSSVLATGSEAERLATLRALRVNYIAQTGVDPFEGAPMTGAATRTKPSSKQARLSRRLMQIDRDLRSRLVTAANAAMMRHLEKAGIRLRSKVNKDPVLRAQIAQTRNELVGPTLGKDAIKAAGYTPATLLNANAWDDFKVQFMSWTSEAQEQALGSAMQLGNIATSDEGVIVARSMLATNLDKAWSVMQDALTAIATHRLHASSLNGEEFNPSTVVPTGTIRAALGVAGGAAEQDFGVITTDSGASIPAISLGTPVGGIGTGSTISDLLTTSGDVAIAGYEWEHGPSLRPFDPHEALDGVQFATFDDDVLANPGDFPSNAYLLPGDHDGCTCDFITLYADGTTGAPEESDQES